MITLRRLSGEGAGIREQLVLDGAGHGTTMLSRNPDLAGGAGGLVQTHPVMIDVVGVSIQHLMKPESIVLAIAGAFFGLIVGWIIGSAAGRPRGRRLAPRQRRWRRPRRPPPRPRSRRRRPWTRRASQALRAAAEKNPSDVQSRVQLGNALLRRRALQRGGDLVRGSARDQPEGPERQHRPRRRLLLPEPARPRARPVRPFPGHRPGAHQDAAQPGDRPRLRAAGPEGGGRVVAALDRRSRPPARRPTRPAVPCRGCSRPIPTSAGPCRRGRGRRSRPEPC